MKVDSQSVLGRFLAGPFESKNKRVSITLCNAPLFFFILVVCWSMHFVGSVLYEMYKIGSVIYCWYFDLKPGKESGSLIPRGDTHIFVDEIRVTPAFWSVLGIYFTGGVAFLFGDYSSGNAVAESIETMPSILWFPAILYAGSTFIGMIIGGLFCTFMTALALVLGAFWCIFKLWERTESVREKIDTSVASVCARTSAWRQSICHRFSINIDLK